MKELFFLRFLFNLFIGQGNSKGNRGRQPSGNKETYQGRLLWRKISSQVQSLCMGLKTLYIRHAASFLIGADIGIPQHHGYQKKPPTRCYILDINVFKRDSNILLIF